MTEHALRRAVTVTACAGLLLAACSSNDDGASGALDDRSNPSLVPHTGGDLAAVENWAYQIQGLDADAYSALEELPVDLVVIDPLDPDSEDIDVAEAVKTLRESPGATLDHKVVLAYVDIGQAEEHRDYWEDDWEVGDPDWIVGTDPDGWEGNFPVEYWRDEWRTIMKDTVEEIARLGVDGIYLDWVEAYDDENAIAAADEAGVDPTEEMVDFVFDLGEWGRAVNGEFLVVAQNAAELGEEEGYLDFVDAVAQEQTFFDGSADPGGREGDCPLPATDDDIGGDAYLASLPDGCEGISTLEMSSEEYVTMLRVIRDEGVVVLTVDYALDPANIEAAFDAAFAEDFIPYAAPRQLDRIGTIAPVG